MSKFLICAVTIICLLMGAKISRAQERVRVGWAAMTASHTPLWVAQDRGFLAKQGLAVESIFFGAGPPAMVEAVRHEYTERGLPAQQLFFDSFDYAPDVLAKLDVSR